MKYSTRSLDRWLTDDRNDYGAADSPDVDAAASDAASTNELATGIYWAVYSTDEQGTYVEFFETEHARDHQYFSMRNIGTKQRTIGRTAHALTQETTIQLLTNRFNGRPVIVVI